MSQQIYESQYPFHSNGVCGLSSQATGCAQIKPSKSLLNLEAAVGKSLASAIECLDLGSSEKAFGSPFEQSVREAPYTPTSNAEGTNHGIRPMASYSQTLTSPQQLDVKEIGKLVSGSPSRGLILINVAHLPSNLVLEAGKKYGAVENLKFYAHKRVVFLSYYDIRSAVCAHQCLGADLVAQTSCENIVVHFSMSLSSTSDVDPVLVQILLNDTSVNVVDVKAVLSSYGPVKGIYTESRRSDGMVSMIVEFFDIRNASLAVKELNSATLWCTNLICHEVRKSTAQIQWESEILKLLAGWEQSYATTQKFDSPTSYGLLAARMLKNGEGYQMLVAPTIATSCLPMYGTVIPNTNSAQYWSPYAGMQILPSLPSSFVMHAAQVDNQDARHRPRCFSAEPSSAQRTSPVWVLHPSTVPDINGPLAPSTSSNVVQSSGTKSTNNQRGVCQTSNSSSNNTEDFKLDVKRVLARSDQRTTVMVRNIPNKYTQQMLLQEINVNHKETYDFFYLPIDFKNKCNVGYAFINFISPLSIVEFYEEFNGRKWKNFNSEKVCCISYARIQGKSSMISRFQNSSLMDKDGEFQPLLFHSSGSNKGKPEKFPIAGKTKRSFSVG